jgi:hypothetical protein
VQIAGTGVFGGVGGDGLTSDHLRSIYVRMSDSIKKPISVHVCAIETTDNKRHWLKLSEIPSIGDTMIIMDAGVFKVLERGQIADAKKLACGWIRIEEIEGRNIAPGSGYKFMEDWGKD